MFVVEDLKLIDTSLRSDILQDLYRNSEANVSKFLENLEEMFLVAGS